MDDWAGFLMLVSALLGSGGLAGAIAQFVRHGRTLQRLDHLEQASETSLTAASSSDDKLRKDIATVHRRVDEVSKDVSTVSNDLRVYREGIFGRLKLLESVETQLAALASRELLTTDKANRVEKLQEQVSKDLQELKTALELVKLRLSAIERDLGS